MVNFNNDWDELLKGEFDKEYYLELRKKLIMEYRTQRIFPGMYDIFNAMKYTAYNDVKCVIIGQDPYHGEGQAHGLSFSVRQGIAPPPSLINIFKEIKDDVGINNLGKHGELTKWAKEGVLLLNSVLTVRANQARSHHGLGWEQFTTDVIKLLADTGLPGMKVAQFAFDPNGDSTHLPHNAEKNSINYVGTHDNNTILGWLWEASEAERSFALSYCHFSGNNWGEGGYRSLSCRSITEAVWQSASNVAVITLQDMCGFGADARMNKPGIAEKNWAFRTTRETIDSIDTGYFKHINSLYRRTYPVFDKKQGASIIKNVSSKIASFSL